MTNTSEYPLFRQTCGIGQYHIQSVLNRKGEPNEHPNAGQPYPIITYQQLREMVMRPPVHAKGDGPWMLASSYNECDARTFDVQMKYGSYTTLLIDFDKGNLPLERVRELIEGLLPGWPALINSTASSKPDDRRWHATLPLVLALPFAAFNAFQLALFNGFDFNGAQVDRTLARAAQLFFTPAIVTPDSHYEWAEIEGASEPELPAWLHDNAKAIWVANETAKRSATASKDHGQHSIIGWVNKTYATEMIFEAYGYDFDGKEWSSPYQQGGSGGHSTMVRDDGSWFSLSNSDAAAGLGKPAKGGMNGDAFDVIVQFPFKGDSKAALAWAKAERHKQSLMDPAYQNALNFVRRLAQ